MPFSVPTLTPAQWRERTKLTFGKRTADTLKLDAAHDLFYLYQRAPTANDYAFKFLRELHDYMMLKSSGTRDWNQVNRNKSNAGIMQIFYEGLKSDLTGYRGVAELAPPVPLPPPTAPLVTSSRSIGDAVEALEDVDIPNARMGVLFLLANIDVEVDLKGVIIDGLGKAAVMGATLGTTHMSASHSSVSATGNVLASDSIGSGLTAALPIRGGGVGITLIGAVNSSDGTTTHLPAYSHSVRPDLSPASGRGRSGGLSTGDHRMPMRPRSGGGALPPTPIPQFEREAPALPPLPTRMERVGDALSSAGTAISGAASEAKAWLIQQLEALFAKIAHQIEKRFKLDTSQTIGLIAGPIKAIIGAAIDALVLAATPFLGASLAVATGIARTTDAVCVKVASWMDRRKIRIMEGHPSAIADAIESQMNWNIGMGLKDVLRGGASLGAQLVTLGAGALVDVILNVVEFLVKTLNRYMEITMTRSFLQLAKRHYEKATEQSRRTRMHGTGRDVLGLPENRSTNVIYNTEEFTSFFELGCEASVVVPMLVLNSSIAGSLMTMIHVTDSKGSRISEEEFAAGDRYFTRLKQLGRQYMQTAGWKFSASNTYVSGLLGHAIHDHQAPASVLEGVRAFVRG
ncbi:hypothetical protein [Terriglobus sp. RCC_193]|uniref:hypothetical protein n=1 Tax=Terriglobus sp. RCC_193 TaxID=3239218 RepID=UPI0035258AC5